MSEIFDYVMNSPYNTNPNVLRSLTENVGGKLPEVTEEDDGKVLTVVNGEWAAAEGGGDDSNIMVLTFTRTGQSGDFEYTPDKTFEEINTHFQSGGILLARYKDDGATPLYYPLVLSGYTGTNSGQYEFIHDNDHYMASGSSSTFGGWYRLCIKYSVDGVEAIDGYVELE